MKRLFLSLLSLVVLASIVSAATHTVNFTVEAGKHARQGEWVCLPLQLPASVTDIGLVVVEDDQGKSQIAAQLTSPGLLTRGIEAKEGKVRKDLHFRLADLPAGKRILTARISHGKDKQPAAGARFAWVASEPPGEWTELRSTRPVLRYMHAKLDESSKAARERTFKVFHHVYDPEGMRFVTNGAGGKFPHHRGLFYGFMKCTYDKNTVDIWHCKDDTHQLHAGFEEEIGGPLLARQRVAIAWNGKGKQTFAMEQREMTVFGTGTDGTLIQFVSRLTPTDGPVKLDGDPQHAGFHFRADNEVNDKTARQTVYIRPDGVDKPGATRNWDGKTNKTHVNLPWLGMSFVLGEQRYTAAYLDRPENPKEARFSERDYGRFGSYFVTTVTKEKPLTVAYRVWLQKGQMKPEEIAALSTAFVEPVSVKVK